MTWLVIVATAILLWLLLWTPKPLRYRGKRLQDLPEFLYSLLVGVRTGGLLYADHEGSERFLQFRKDRLPSGERRVHFAFPDAPWSRGYYEPLRRALEAAGMTCGERIMDEGETRRFLVVDGLTQGQAYRAAEIACGVMNLPPEATFTIHFAAIPSYSEFRAYAAKRRPRS